MKIILNQDVKHLGHKDDVVSVKDGYGRNYLIPQGMAKLATASAVKILEEEIKQRAFKQEKLKKDAEVLSEKLANQSITLKTKTGTTGKIFGAVTTLQVANALKDKGLDVDRRKIVFNDEIKMVGAYKATINLYKGISTEIDIQIESEG
ncbi:MAG: 50S ribosomal protein L9 [Bacteroidia bacterium]|nr:50S ribosomal protein L9 [Bacteroidia bacterium]MCO5253260.1 50S ribosomal protein L9 [Bacteroidota bacterium]